MRQFNDIDAMIGIYLRLSKEDEGNLSESESIANQRTLIYQYCANMGWQIISEYVDDGFSGLNFDRPDFKRMLSDIKTKKINCIITKDLSRLGRDYIETGYYIEKYFPENGIRYIAISDGIDTFANMHSDITPFRAVLNDMYAKDISKKVRDALSAKKQSGDFIGAFAPYGYKKSPDNKNKLVVDPDTSPVVKRIFDMYLDGMGYIKISKQLTSEEIDSPSVHKKKTSNYKNSHKVNFDRWTPDTIRKMLSNPVYIGDMAQGKQTIINYKINKKIDVPKDQWVVVENKHEAIIDIEVFKKVQDLLSRNITRPRNNSSSILLTGIFFCGDCGTRMTSSTYTYKTKANKVIYVCTKWKRFGACTNHSIEASEIESYIINEIKALAHRILNYEKLLEIADQTEQKNNHNNINKANQEIKKLEKKLEGFPTILKTLYYDKLNGVINENNFIILKNELEQEEIETKEKLEQLKKIQIDEANTTSDRESVITLIKEMLTFEKIDRSILQKLVKRVEIMEDKTVIIEYTFKDPTI